VLQRVLYKGLGADLLLLLLRCSIGYHVVVFSNYTQLLLLLLDRFISAAAASSR